MLAKMEPSPPPRKKNMMPSFVMNEFPMSLSALIQLLVIIWSADYVLIFFKKDISLSFAFALHLPLSNEKILTKTSPFDRSFLTWSDANYVHLQARQGRTLRNFLRQWRHMRPSSPPPPSPPPASTFQCGAFDFLPLRSAVESLALEDPTWELRPSNSNVSRSAVGQAFQYLCSSHCLPNFCLIKCMSHFKFGCGNEM